MSTADVSLSPAKRRRFPIRLPFGVPCGPVIWILAGIAVCLLLVWHYLHSFAMRTQSVSNLKSLAIALHNYHDIHQCFPPPIAQIAAKPAHSWRAFMVPCLPPGFHGMDDFKRDYRFDEPWNGPHNKTLLATHWFGKTTQYLAVVGAETMWPPDGRRTMRDVSDGLDNTILVVEYPDSRIRWLEPGDLSLEGNELYLQTGAGPKRVSIAGCNVVMASGSVRRLSPKITPGQILALLTVNGGEPHFDW